MSSKHFCKKCNRCFSRLAALENHVRQSHPVNEAIIRAKCLERLPSKKAAAKKASKDVKKSPASSDLVRTPGYPSVPFGKENSDQRFGGLQESSGIDLSGRHENSGPNVSGRHESSGSNVNLLSYSTIIDAQNKNTQSQVISQVMSSVSEGNKKPQSFPEKTSSINNVVALQTASNHRGSKIAPDIKKEKSHYRFQVKGSTGSNFQSLYEKAKVASSVVAVTSASRDERPKSREKNRRVFDVIVNDNDGTHYCFACKAYLFSLGSFVNHSCYGVQKGAAGRLCRDCGKGRHECLCGHHVLKVTIEERSVFCEPCKKWFPSSKLRDSHDCIMKKKIKEEVDSEMEISQEPLEHDREDSLESIPQKSASAEDTKSHSNFVKCLYCKEVFEDDFQFYNHMLSHKELTHFDCFFCRVVFSSGASLKEHLKSEHDHQMGENRNEMEQIQTESGVRFRCSLCPQTFTCKSNRRRHEHRHFGIRPHKCDLCGASFRQRWQLSSHKSSRRCQENIVKLQNMQIKTDVEPLERIITPAGVPGSRKEGSATGVAPSAESAATSPTPGSPNIASIPTPSLSTDFSSSNENMCLDKNGPVDLTNMTTTVKQESPGFWCTECGKVCKTKRNLRIHSRIHTGERPYSCTECELTFRQSHHRKAHMLSRHGKNPSAGRKTGTGEIVVVTEGGIRFKCRICSKVLMSRSGRRKHERWHLGLRPHRCNNCGNMFKQLQHLKKHQRSTNCRSARLSMMIASPKKEVRSMSESEFGASRLSLTSLHLLKVARRLRELTPSDNTVTDDNTLASDEQKTMEMPLALGLIGVEELKVKQEEERKRKAQAKSYVEEEYNLDGQVAKKIKLEHDRSEFSSSSNLSGLIEKLAANVKATVKEEILSEESSDEDDCDDLQEEEDTSESALHIKDDSENSNANDEDVPSNLTTGDSASGISASHGPEEDSEVELKPVQCLVCGQFYQTKEGLQLHMHVHKEDRPYTCTLCPRTFRQGHHLGAHMRVTHCVDKDKASLIGYEEDGGVLTDEGIRYKCQHCSKLLTSRNGRRKHERWHLGLRPYICDVCGNAFKQSHHLKRHKMGINCIPLEAQKDNQSDQNSLPLEDNSPSDDDQRMEVDTIPSDDEKQDDPKPSRPVDLGKVKLEVDAVRSEEGNTVVKLRFNTEPSKRASPVNLVQPAVGVDSISADPASPVDLAKGKTTVHSDNLHQEDAVSLVRLATKVDSIQSDKKRSFIPVTLDADSRLTPCTGPVEDSNGNITTKIGLNGPYPASTSKESGIVLVNSLVCEETLSDSESIPQDLSVLSSRN